jgi:hypothetical protein
MGDVLDSVLIEITRAVDNLGGRVSGPMKFRLILQPAVAIYLAVRAGLQDAAAARVPYFWALFTTPEHRRDLLREGWKDVGKVFVAAVLIDTVYQVVVSRWVYPGEALVVAVVLALVPYLAVRGPVTRITRRR